jgi:hypothetical protein
MISRLVCFFLTEHVLLLVLCFIGCLANSEAGILNESDEDNEFNLMPVQDTLKKISDLQTIKYLINRNSYNQDSDISLLNEKEIKARYKRAFFPVSSYKVSRVSKLKKRLINNDQEYEMFLDVLVDYLKLLEEGKINHHQKKLVMSYIAQMKKEMVIYLSQKLTSSQPSSLPQSSPHKITIDSEVKLVNDLFGRLSKINSNKEDKNGNNEDEGEENGATSGPKLPFKWGK